MNEKDEHIISLVRNSGIKNGDFVWLFADITRLVLSYRKQGKRFDPNVLIDRVLEQIGPEGTLILPTLNFDLKAERIMTGTKLQACVGPYLKQRACVPTSNAQRMRYTPLRYKAN